MEKHLDIKKYLLRGGAWAFIGKVLTALMGLALSALLARLLSPEDMGAYFLAFSLTTFLAILARMGLENTLLRFISEALAQQRPGHARSVILKGLHLGLVSSTLVAIIVYFFAGPWVTQYLFKSDALVGIIGFISIWLVLLAFQFLFAEIFRAFHDIRMAILFGGLITSVATVIFVATYMLLKGHAVLSQVLPWILLAGALNILLALWMLARKLCDLQPPSKVQSVKYSRLINHSWPLLINAVTLFLLSQSDLWVLAAFYPDEEIAVYGAAARLVLLTGMALTIVNAVVPPLITRLNVQDDRKRLEHILRVAATYAAIPSLIVLAVFIFFGNWVLGTIYGDYYRSGGIILMILSVGQVANVIVGSCAFTLVMTGHRLTVMLISVVSAVIAIGSSLVLVQSYGATGLAAGYAFAMVVQQSAMLLFARHHVGIWTHAHVCCFSISTFIRKWPY